MRPSFVSLDLLQGIESGEPCSHERVYEVVPRVKVTKGALPHPTLCSRPKGLSALSRRSCLGPCARLSTPARASRAIPAARTRGGLGRVATRHEPLEWNGTPTSKVLLTSRTPRSSLPETPFLHVLRRDNLKRSPTRPGPTGRPRPRVYGSVAREPIPIDASRNRPRDEKETWVPVKEARGWGLENFR